MEETLKLIKNNSAESRLLIILDSLFLNDKEACNLASTLNSTTLPKECSLYLGANNIGDTGAIALFNSIQQMPKKNYCYLSLDNNQISDKAIHELAKGFKYGLYPDSLFICLGWNKITAVGLRLLIEALESPNAPQKLTLSLSGNNFNRNSIDSLIDALKENKFPPRLMIYGLNQTIISLCEKTKSTFMHNLAKENSPFSSPSSPTSLNEKKYSLHTLHGAPCLNRKFRQKWQQAKNKIIKQAKNQAHFLPPLNTNLKP